MPAIIKNFKSYTRMKECLKNKLWRIEHLYYIQNKSGKLIRFKLNEAQKHFFFNRTGRDIILKSRQLGFSTFAIIDMLDTTLFLPNTHNLFIAHKREDAGKIFDSKVRLAWDNIGFLNFMWSCTSDRAQQLKFKFQNGKTVSTSSISVSTSGRSGTHYQLHVSELAKLFVLKPKEAQEIISGTMPSVPDNGKIVIESTAEGQSGLFYDLYMKARAPNEKKVKLEMTKFFYNWTWDQEEMGKTEIVTHLPSEFKEYQKMMGLTDLQISYYYNKFILMGQDRELINQEYPTTEQEAFISSSKRFFMIPEGFDNNIKKPIITNGDWKIYEDYNPRHKYCIGVDVAEGIGEDSSSIVVVDLTSMMVVAIYKSNTIPADLLAYEIKTIGNRYGTCITGVEANNHGIATIVKLREIYPEHKIYKKETIGTTKDGETNRFGWLTTRSSKPKMLYELRDCIAQNEIIIPDKALLLEIKTYNKDELNNVRTNPDVTQHYDVVMALAIAYQMRNNQEGFVMNYDVGGVTYN